jgi:hypothetical protein
MKKLVLSLAVLSFMVSCNKEESTTSISEIENENSKAVTSRFCATDSHYEYQLKKDPSLAYKMEEIERNTANAIASGRIVNGVIEIPVVFNVLYRTTAENVSESQLRSQIDVLNKDFSATNSDINTPNNPYSSVRANVGIRFVLDQIVRKATTKVSWSESDVDNDRMKSSTTGGVNATSPTTKLNIWIVSSMPSVNGETLGFAQFPGGPTATDGVVLAGKFTGTNGTAQAPFNLGRTATHEVGHWMNLRHIWGDAICGSDRVSDTPVHDGANVGVPAAGLRSTCTGRPLEMFMNYMDYTDDRGMYMFSVGQANRMLAVFSTTGSRKSFR